MLAWERQLVVTYCATYGLFSSPAACIHDVPCQVLQLSQTLEDLPPLPLSNCYRTQAYLAACVSCCTTTMATCSSRLDKLFVDHPSMLLAKNVLEALCEVLLSSLSANLSCSVLCRAATVQEAGGGAFSWP